MPFLTKPFLFVLPQVHCPNDYRSYGLCGIVVPPILSTGNYPKAIYRNLKQIAVLQSQSKEFS